ncbi:ABC transporter ATP-binding protein [uncultured Allofournierella sp.]|uniref:ABC transporter ATP-binding protein n=1 Tax=uncultured Allofournierella sp. TaxID=1940258 RepID=UPI003750C855
MLTLQALTHTFQPGTPTQKQVLKDLSLHLEEGEFAVVVGSNGAGKSTLMAAISGAFYPDGGRILLDGKDITLLPEHRRSRQIGRLFQDPLKGTAPHLTVEENLRLALHRSRGSLWSMPPKVISQELRKAVAQLDMGLEERMHQPVGLLSGGQRQALTLLMATLVPPRLLLLDEHTAALDPAAAQQVLELTCRLVEQHNITCLMITHDMHTALKVGSRTLMMDQGRIVLDLQGQSRAAMTVQELAQQFRQKSGTELTQDRMLLA